MLSNSKKPVSAAQTRAQSLTARFQARVTVPPGAPTSIAYLEARATELRDVIEAGERPHATPPARMRAGVAARLLPAIEAQIEVLQEEAAAVAAPDATPGLLRENRATIGSLNALIRKVDGERRLDADDVEYLVSEIRMIVICLENAAREAQGGE